MHRHLNLFIAGTIAFSAVACGDDVAVEPTPDIEITTSSLPGGNEGTNYQVEVTAAGGTGEDFRWSLADGGLPTGVFLRSEGTPSTVIAGVPRSGGTSTFTLRVRDSEGNEATADLSIEITGAPPGVSITTTMLPQPAIFETYTATITAENGQGYSWRLLSGELPPGLTLGEMGTPSTTLSGTPTLLGDYSFTIRVEDADGNRDEQQYRFEVVDVREPLSVLQARLPDATVSVAYTFDFVANGGSGMGYEWSVVSGSLPPGLSLAEMGTPNARLSGTPTLRGSYSFRIEVVDSEGNRARQSFFVEVAPEPPPLRIVTFELPNARVGTSYSQTIRAVNGSSMGYTWTIAQGNLPPGLTLVDGTPEATLSGNPTQAGSYEFLVRVQDSIGSQNEQIFTIDVAERIIPPTITATSAVLQLPNAQGGQPYSATIEATDGAPIPPNAGSSAVRYNWVVTGGSLPPGLQLNPIGQGATYAGTFDGVPTALGSYTATVTVYDRANNTDSQVIRIFVDPPSIPLTIDTTSLPAFAGAGCYSTSVSASGGGNAGFTWAVSAGSLPPGFTLAPSGTPSASIAGAAETPSGTYNVTIEVTDTFGLAATQNFTITVDPNKVGVPRWGMIVGDVETANQSDIFVSDLCSSPPGTPVRVNPTTNPNLDIVTGTRDIAQSPAGNAIAFIGDLVSDGREDVWVVDLRNGPQTGEAVRVFTGNSTFQDANEIRWSPDGRKLAILTDFSSSGSDELWVADVSNLGAPQQAVRVSQQGSSSSQDVYDEYAFSPDGNWIAWVGDNATSSRNEAWVVDLRGATPSAPARLHGTFSSSSMDVNGDIQWAPDSRGVVFNGDLRNIFRDELFFTDITGAPPYSETAISGNIQSSGDIDANFNSAYQEHFAFSPDGTKLFFVGDGTSEGEDDMYLLDYANGVFSNLRNITQLTSSFATCDSGKWSPDSTRIAVRGDLQSSSQDELFVFDANATSLPVPTNQPLRGATTSLEMGFSFWDDYGWSPDGNKIAFIGDFDRSAVDEIYLSDVSGSPPYSSTKLNPSMTSSAEDIGEFQFSPDSQRIAFLGDVRSSYDELWVVDISGATPGTAVRAHSPFTSTSFDVLYNTDGYDNRWFWVGERALMFVGDIETSAEDRLWYVDVSGSAPYEPTNVTAPGWYQGSSQDVFFFRR